MTLFFISAALLVLLSMGWILAGVFRSNTQFKSTDQEAVNITLARERGKTLDNALADGSIDQSTYDYEREQLEYDLAADLRSNNVDNTRSGGQISAAAIVTLFVPLAAGALYLQLGNPGAITQSTISQSNNSGNENAPALSELLPQMEQRLLEQPDDIEGWRLLGRSYLSVGEFDRARSAFEQAVALDENDAPTLAQMAETIAMTQQGELSGEPLQFIERAIEIEPDNEHAIWLMSIAQQQMGNHEAAMQGFDRLTTMAAGNPEAMATVEQMRSRSVEAMSEEASTTRLETPDSENVSSSQSQQTTGQGANDQTGPATIEITVSLSEQARAASTNDQSVFIYATASEGPPMPLAVSRLTVADLPTTITLDDSMAMIPNMTLSAFNSVTVGARVSKSGNPISEPGDWFNEAANVATDEAAALSLTIDQQAQ